MDFIDVPIDELVDQDYSNKRWNEIDFNQSRESKDITRNIV